MFWPIDPASPVDVVWRAEPGAAWRSAQVKKVYQKDGHRTVNITKREGGTYDITEVDYFAFVDYDAGHLWLLRSDKLFRKRPIHTYTRVRLTADWDSFRREL